MSPVMMRQQLLRRVNRILKRGNNQRYHRGAIVPLNSPNEVVERIGLKTLARQMGLLPGVR